MLNCALCVEKKCREGEKCQSTEIEEYQLEDNKKLFQTAAAIEAEGYMKWFRLEELIRFCLAMNYSHLGIAFCVGLEREAKILYDILSQHFKISSVCCKNGGNSKDDYSLPHIRRGQYETMCNPIGQAKLLNQQSTDLNIIFGLCIGHDILFSKHSQAPVTTLVVKDRVLAHNPIGAIYSNYYKNRLISK